MATPASLFVPRPESIAELVLPPELSIVAGERSVVIEPEDEPEHFSDDPLTPPDDISAVEFTRVVPPSGNISISEQQIWVGPRAAGRVVEIWADTVSVHVSLDGRAPQDRAVASDDPLPSSSAARRSHRRRAATSRTSRHRTARSRRHLGARAHGQRHGPRRPRRQAVQRRHRPGRPTCAHPPPRRRRPRGARRRHRALLRLCPRAVQATASPRSSSGPNEQPDSTPSPIVVGRRVSPSGDITVGGQRIHLGLTNATKTVEVLVEARYLRVMDQGATIKVVARNTTEGGEPLQSHRKGLRILGMCKASSEATA